MKTLINSALVLFLAGLVVVPVLLCSEERRPRPLTLLKFGATLVLAVAAACYLTSN